jgi:hypothetical protein
MIIEPMTVSQVLTAGMDSVNLINSINTDVSAVDAVDGKTQSEINDVVDKNVRHLETILAYDGTDDIHPDVAGSDDDKTPYTDAITTGKAYITNNS